MAPPAPPRPPANVRRNQCAACPWKRSTDPARDIPGGYSVARHEALRRTVAEPGSLAGVGRAGLRVMACHESAAGRKQVCAGWLLNQLGPGNNLALRVAAMAGRYGDVAAVRLDGPQHACLEDTLPRRGRRRGRQR